MQGTREILGEDQYWSIVLPNYYRFPYLEQCIDSIEKFADMPYELIVHDDGSKDDSPENILKMKDRISTIIYNTGHNFGLSRSADRCMQLAHSKYILFMNTDAIVEKKCLRAFKDMLDKEYIGMVSVHSTSNADKVFKSNNTYFRIENSMAKGYAFAIRKDVWAAAGGWDYDAFTGVCDSAFLGRMAQAGYFCGGWREEGNEVGRIIGNTGVHCTQEKNWKGSSTQYGSFDNAYPHLFNLPEGMHNEGISRARHDLCTKRIHDHEKDIGNNVNLWYWHDFYKAMVKGPVTIDWDVAERHPQFSRWKGMIEKEQVYTL